MITVGIDPGKSGACAILKDGKFQAVLDMPYHDNELLVAEITDWIGCHGKPDLVLYEKQWPRQGDGGSRAWHSGYNYCLLEWQLWACYDLRAVAISPQKWEKAAGLIGQDKKASVRKAREEFPEAEHWLKRWKDDGRAEAMLIAKYGGG